MRKRIKTFGTFRIELSSKEVESILAYLKGETTSRELAKVFGISHQQSINRISQICRQWVQEGHLIFYATGKKNNYSINK